MVFIKSRQARFSGLDIEYIHIINTNKFNVRNIDNGIDFLENLVSKI